MSSATANRDSYGVGSMVLPLKRVLVHCPADTVAQADPTVWNYSGMVDPVRARREHRQFIALLGASGIEVTYLEDDALGALPDAIFTHDSSIVTARGAIICRMGKELRRGEQGVHERTYNSLGIPILGRIEAPGTLESGDCVWLDAQTLFVGRGFRTNRNGISQVTALLKPLGVDVLSFDLPVWGGSRNCLHLMSIVSLLDTDLALCVRPALSVELFQELLRRGIRIVEAPLDEFESSRTISANVLAIAPRDCVMVDGYPRTRAALMDADCRVRTYTGDEICTKMEGGPTCLTRPLLRELVPAGR